MTPKPLFATSVAARLPLATFSIGILVHVEHLTGSYASAGVVAGGLAVAQGVGGPLLGRLVDRHGQTVVLLAAATAAAAALTAVAAVPAGTPLAVLLALAAVVGLATPPVGACLRTLIPLLLPAAADRRRAYAVDATATELTWVSGPPLALVAGSAFGSGTALTAAGVVLVVATALFAASPVSRSWRPAGVARSGRSPLTAPAMRTLVIVLTGVGVLFGATEVAVTAATDTLGVPVAAGALLGLWGLGSLAGGVLAARLGGGASGGRGFAALLAALGFGHLALGPAAGNVVTLGVVIALAGTMIAPILATAYAMVDDAAPAGTVTEAFAWLATATAIGTSVGAAAGGMLADAAGPASVFALAGLAALAAALVCAVSIPAARPAVPAVG